MWTLTLTWICVLSVLVLRIRSPCTLSSTNAGGERKAGGKLTRKKRAVCVWQNAISCIIFGGNTPLTTYKLALSVNLKLVKRFIITPVHYSCNTSVLWKVYVENACTCVLGHTLTAVSSLKWIFWLLWLWEKPFLLLSRDVLLLWCCA